MTNQDAQRRFLEVAAKIQRGVAAASLRAVEDPAVAVPGFMALEVDAQVPVRGWVRGDTVVMARSQNFGPALDALRFADDARWPTPDGLVARLVWLHGPPYQLITHLAEGELGADDELDLTPRRVTRDDGRVALFFALLDPGGPLPGGKLARPVVFQYRIVRTAEGDYLIGTTQLAPVPDQA
ncbi:MAG: hypothetical protein IPI49_29885 [Myxococcales bacterium]|nr:hypothetical protein [Myxococcales bacterium]